MTDEINAYWHPDGSGIDAVFAERDALRVEVERLRSERIEVLNLNASQAHKIARAEITAARYLAALQQIAAAGPMFSPDDWRWKVAQDAVKGQGESPYDEIARLKALNASAIAKLRWAARRMPGIWGGLVVRWADCIERGEPQLPAAPVSDADVEQTVEGYPV